MNYWNENYDLYQQYVMTFVIVTLLTDFCFIFFFFARVLVFAALIHFSSSELLAKLSDKYFLTVAQSASDPLASLITRLFYSDL